LSLYFLFADAAAPHIYTLSLHDALPIYGSLASTLWPELCRQVLCDFRMRARSGPNSAPATKKRAAAATRLSFEATVWRLLSRAGDRKSTRLNSSHVKISYAVFCLKKKKK